MNTVIHIKKRSLFENENYSYPVLSVCVSIALICLAPFTTKYLSLIAFAVCIYRVLRFDVITFAIDYCVTFPFVYLFKIPGGTSLHYYLCIIGVLWFFFKGRYYRFDLTFIGMFALIIYLFFRMETDISGFVICFGQILLIYVLMQKMNEKHAIAVSKAFITGVLLSSVYAFIFRNTYQILSYIRSESVAYWGSELGRFRGLFEDPNYYMTTISVALALIIKFRICGVIKSTQFMLLAVALSFFGMLSYSKTFFIVFVVLVLSFIALLFIRKKYLAGVVSIVVCAAAFVILLNIESSPLAVILYRIAQGSDLSDFTTGRSDIFIRYVKAIFESPLNCIFGGGFDNPILGKATHNLFLEIVYYTGIIGFFLYGFYFIALVLTASRKREQKGQGFLLKYLVLIVCCILFLSLHGMLTEIPYVFFFLAISSILITNKNTGKKELLNDRKNSKETE